MKKVLLTGISGFVGKQVAIELLSNNYEVIGTVRSKNLILPTQNTIKGQGVKIDNLSFLELDLLSDTGWDDAARGCNYIIHVATPFPMKVSRDRERLTPVAVDGMLRVFNAGISANVEHFVLTSSMFAMSRQKNRTNPYFIGENDWTDLGWSGASDYFVAKTKQEKAAWKLMEKRGIKDKLTVINPGAIWGRALDHKLSTSLVYIKNFLLGQFPAAPNAMFLISDITDVAKAHVISLSNNEARGRRLIVGSEAKSLIDVSEILSNSFPKYKKKLPKRLMPNFLVKIVSFFDSSIKTLIPDLGLKLVVDTSYSEKILNFKFKSAENSIVEAAQSLIDLRIIK